MGTPENLQDIIKMVKGAFAPDADPASRQSAATVLRSLLGALGAEGSEGQAAQTEFLDSLIAKFRPMLPKEVSANVSCLDIPMVPLDKP